MKILVVIPSIACGGAERVVSLLTQEWSRSNSVDVVIFDGNDISYKIAADIIDIDVKSSKHLINQLFNSLIRIIRLIKIISNRKPDRIISFMESANFPSIIASTYTKDLSRLTVSIHNNPDSFHYLYKILIPILYRKAGRVIAVSKGVCGAVESLCKSNIEIECINNPIDLVDVIHKVDDGIKEEFNINSPYILAVGRLSYQKGFDRLLKAFSDLKFDNCKLVILGEGPKRKELEQLIFCLGLEEKVFLLGIVANPYPFYKNAEIFVLSSRFEGWGNVLLEAMAAGCPVISYDCLHGPEEIINDNVNGILVSEGDVQGLTDAMNRVLSSPFKAASLVNAAKIRVKDFDVKDIAYRWLI